MTSAEVFPVYLFAVGDQVQTPEGWHGRVALRAPGSDGGELDHMYLVRSPVKAGRWFRETELEEAT